eukprot:11090954-Ditylum_brightwellii.AAC.1
MSDSGNSTKQLQHSVKDIVDILVGLPNATALDPSPMPGSSSTAAPVPDPTTAPPSYVHSLAKKCSTLASNSENYAPAPDPNATSPSYAHSLAK